MAHISLWNYSIVEGDYIFENSKTTIASFFQSYGMETTIDETNCTVKANFPNASAYFLVEWKAKGYGATANLYGGCKIQYYNSDGTVYSIITYNTNARYVIVSLDYLETKNGVLFGVYCSSVSGEQIGEHGYRIFCYIDSQNKRTCIFDVNSRITLDGVDGILINNLMSQRNQISAEAIQLAPLLVNNEFDELCTATVAPIYAVNAVYTAEVEGKNYYIVSHTNAGGMFAVEMAN